MDCTLYVDPEDQKHLGAEHCVAVFNHTYEIDWLVAWMMADRHAMFGGSKIYGKDILKYVPIQGWTWYFTESIFLKRDWEVDREILKKSIAEIVTYPPGLWVALLLFPEGTRWTPAKHEASLKIAREKGYPEYKRMLLPRTKGFALSMQLMKGKVPTVFDITIGFPSDEPEPTLMDAIRGKKIRSAMKVKRYEIKDIPADTEEECAKWLRDIYKQKDDDLDTYLRTGKFEGAPAMDVPKRKYDLYCYIFWVITTTIPLFYYIRYLVLYASLVHQISVVVVILLLIFLMKWMIGFTQIKKGSTYGNEKKKKE